MLKGYDIDGVITAGITPSFDAVIITGRSYEEAPETIEMLRRRGIFNAVYFNPIKFEDKTLENSGRWKAQAVNILGVAEFYEDNEIQFEIISKNTNAKVHKV